MAQNSEERVKVYLKIMREQQWLRVGVVGALCPTYGFFMTTVSIFSISSLRNWKNRISCDT